MFLFFAFTDATYLVIVVICTYKKVCPFADNELTSRSSSTSILSQFGPRLFRSFL